MKKILLICLTSFILVQVNGQGLKSLKKDRSEIYECGYVHKITLKEKANPMKALQKGIGGSVTNGNNSDLGTVAISVFYQAHLHPQSIMKYPTKIPGWETCGDAVFAGFTNRDGMGLSSTDGTLTMNGQEIGYSGVGTYFQGFSPTERGDKEIKITSSNGDEINVTLGPAKPLEILTVNGKTKEDGVVIDGTEDVVIELANGDADPNSRIHVQLICKLMGTPIIYDIIVTRAKNTIYIPKEAFKNFEGSPSPFAKTNTLIVNRITESIIDNTSAGAIRTISAYMDWMPISVSGDLSKGNVLTMGFDTTKNTQIKIDLETEGEYNFVIAKSGPYSSPPVKIIKKVALASFVIRGNLVAEETTVTPTTITEVTKWFPELDKASWQDFADQFYNSFVKQLEADLGWDILTAQEVVNSESYRHSKSVKDDLNKTFVEVGAMGTNRILTTSGVDLWKDLSITFPSDFISERLVNELGVDMVLAITIDLNFNFKTEGLDPKIYIEAYAPNISYKTGAKYFSINAETLAKSLKDSQKYAGSASSVLYQTIKGKAFIQGFVDAMKSLSEQEDQYPVYEALWNAKF